MGGLTHAVCLVNLLDCYNTYGEITINEAVVKCKEFYDPNYNRTRAVEGFKELLPTGNTTIRAIPDTEPLPQETKI